MAKLRNKTKDFEITTVSQGFPSSNIFVNSIPTYCLPVTRDNIDMPLPS